MTCCSSVSSSLNPRFRYTCPHERSLHHRRREEEQEKRERTTTSLPNPNSASTTPLITSASSSIVAGGSGMRFCVDCSWSARAGKPLLFSRATSGAYIFASAKEPGTTTIVGLGMVAVVGNWWREGWKCREFGRCCWMSRYDLFVRSSVVSTRRIDSVRFPGLDLDA